MCTQNGDRRCAQKNNRAAACDSSTPGRPHHCQQLCNCIVVAAAAHWLVYCPINNATGLIPHDHHVVVAAANANATRPTFIHINLRSTRPRRRTLLEPLCCLSQPASPPSSSSTSTSLAWRGRCPIRCAPIRAPERRLGLGGCCGRRSGSRHKQPPPSWNSLRVSQFEPNQAELSSFSVRVCVC